MATKERPDHVILRTYKARDGKSKMQAHTPESVLPIHDKDELKGQLRHYGKLLLGLTTANNQTARRHYLELIRPALRYYCKKFQVEVPDWLKNDDYYTKTMSAAERAHHFGHQPLRVSEFKKLQPIPGAMPHNAEEEPSDAGG